jgi:hypothetical protein
MARWDSRSLARFLASCSAVKLATPREVVELPLAVRAFFEGGGDGLVEVPRADAAFAGDPPAPVSGDCTGSVEPAGRGDDLRLVETLRWPCSSAGGLGGIEGIRDFRGGDTKDGGPGRWSATAIAPSSMGRIGGQARQRGNDARFRGPDELPHGVRRAQQRARATWIGEQSCKVVSFEVEKG